MDSDDLERLVKLESRCEELARADERIESWARQEFLSTMENQRQQGEHIARLDETVRGRDGGNGLSGKLHGLEARSDVHKAHFDGRLRDFSQPRPVHRQFVSHCKQEITIPVLKR